MISLKDVQFSHCGVLRIPRKIADAMEGAQNTLINNKGEPIWTFDHRTTDKEIFNALNFALTAYQQGLSDASQVSEEEMVVNIDDMEVISCNIQDIKAILDRQFCKKG